MYNFKAENNFFYNIDHSRASKIFFQIELFKNTLKINGDICEFGVFKGNSLNRIILLRDFYVKKKKIFAFDTFKRVILHKKHIDFKNYKKFLNESNNYQYSMERLKKKLKSKKMFSGVKLIKGDVIKTLKLQKINKISFILLDLDIYEPTSYVLNYIWPKISKNGIILLDNYKVFKGETKAVDEFVKKNKLKIYKKKFYRNFYFLKK